MDEGQGIRTKVFQNTVWHILMDFKTAGGNTWTNDSQQVLRMTPKECLELLGSYIMELTHGSWQWDYRHYAFNFQGRIAPNPSIRFGIGGMVILYLLHPLARRFTEKASLKVQRTVAVICLVLFAADCIHYVVSNWI